MEQSSEAGQGAPATDHKSAPITNRRNQAQTSPGAMASAHLFASLAVILLATLHWPVRWILSGAPLLTYSILLGAANGNRILSYIPLWTLVVLINLAYALAATSWLLYWVFLVTCYPATFLSCLFQFGRVAHLTRRYLRLLLRELHFAHDTVAFFDLPALEIDIDVEGLLCVRGLSFSFSSLSIVVVGIEVGIKLSDDMEVAIVADKVTVKLFRKIEVTDVYANIKGGSYEMTHGRLARRSHDDDGDPIMIVSPDSTGRQSDRPPMARKLTEHMTGGTHIKDSTVRNGLDSVRKLSPEDDKADEELEYLVSRIQSTSSISTTREELKSALDRKSDDTISKREHDVRAAICTSLHHKATISHTARKSIKVSTIHNTSPPWLRKFMHRLPLLLRIALNPLSYFHPIQIESVTAGGSGRFLQKLLEQHVFPLESDTGIRNLKQRILGWLSDANFVLQAVDVGGEASVPITTSHSISSALSIGDVIAYRTIAKGLEIDQVMRLAGADARIAIPCFLLPHHEHILPPLPTEETTEALKEEIEKADGKPNTVKAQKDLEKTNNDKTQLHLSAHVRLPAVLNQDLLDFIAALVKTTKIVEMEKDDPVEKEHRTLKQAVKGLGDDMVDSMRRVAVDAAANDRWIAKLVGKATKNLESIQGDIGYSGFIPIALKPYRDAAEPDSKLLA